MDELYDQERKARTEGNTEKMLEIQQSIIEHCKTDGDVIIAMKSLTNKRCQDPECIKTIIRKLYNEKKSLEFYYALLSEVIEAKIYLEEERLYIAEHIKLLHGNNISAAYAVIRDVPVETFTSVKERHRNEFLFEQFRLSLLLGQYHESDLIAKRVRKSYMNAEEKVIFHNYVILLKLGTKSYLDAASIYLELNGSSPSKKNIALGSFYCMLSSCLIEGKNVVEPKVALLTEFANNKMNDPIMRTFVLKFNTDLIIDFSIIESIMNNVKRIDDEMKESLIDIYREELRSSVIEHNLFVVKKFISKIKIYQVCTILKLSEENLLDFISTMVNERCSDIRINQVDGLVDFGVKRWHHKVDDVLDKVVAATNLIHQDSITDQ